MHSFGHLFSHNQEIQFHGIWILVRVMSGSADNKNLVAEKGGLGEILTAMENHGYTDRQPAMIISSFCLFRCLSQSLVEARRSRMSVAWRLALPHVSQRNAKPSARAVACRFCCTHCAITRRWPMYKSMPSLPFTDCASVQWCANSLKVCHSEFGLSLILSHL